MSIAIAELQVSAGLANDYDLRTLHYGALLHWRRMDGTGVREVFEYRAFVDSNTNPLRLNGIEPDDDRIDFQRGHGTALDERLVRRSAFRFAPSATPGQADGALQQVFVVLKPKNGSSLQPALDLKLICGPNQPPRKYPQEGLPPVCVWSTEDWRDCVFVDVVPYQGDVTEWTEALGRGAEAALAESLVGGARAADPKPASTSSRSDCAEAPRLGASTVDTAEPMLIRVDASADACAMEVVGQAHARHCSVRGHRRYSRDQSPSQYLDRRQRCQVGAKAAGGRRRADCEPPAAVSRGVSRPPE